MQNRYVGDIGDYSKFVLIKNLFNGKCGIIWYLYPNEGHNNDGKFRNYEKFELQDKEIVEIMSYFSKHKESERSVQELEKILINNGFDLTFFSNCIECNCKCLFSNVNERLEYRKSWFDKALNKMKNCNIVFADPDNGIEVKSCPLGDVKSGKYIYFDEISKLLKNHKTVVIYQHFERSKTHRVLVDEKVKKLYEKIGNNFNFYAVKFKKVSPRAYFILSKENLENKIREFCDEFKNEFELLKG
ncbi:conserved hypothetical protein [Lebetimonas natsushimae]|uniref:Uncharacterized protein n=1 Tax=Lebetimonas natsushimae TaxID=1936991 RepID=A0A292YET2_9BACT|nr:hypothetical protein [Lebetimonas natsushimae]GAX87645.1 conserved hypothetical protein [Lebetimonas natsushimae]